jgi:hypothetical protein
VSLSVGEERQFDGTYVAHWEVSRFEIVTGRRFFGLLETTECCRLETAEGIEPLEAVLFGGQIPENWRRSGGARFAMSFEGRVLERGDFGHMGWCRWRVLVLRWLNVERLDAVD